MPELWQPIPGFDGYEASSEGRIRSPRKVLKPWTVGRYLKVEIKRKQLGVHRLVATAFHGEPESGMQCLHHDDDPTNNKPENLYWGTHAQNMQDKIKNGGSLKGESNPSARMTSEQIQQIRQSLEHGESQSSLARRFGVSRALVQLVMQRKRWAHLP